MNTLILPYPEGFPDKLHDYCTQIQQEISSNCHHDMRRHLFLNFIQSAFGINHTEIELEHKIRAGELRGRIDALYRHIIIEIKSSFDAERDDAQRELRKYIESRSSPSDYIAIVTDGLRCEAFHLNSHGVLVSISETTLSDQEPLVCWRWIEQFLCTTVRLVPSSEELVARFGVNSVVYKKSADCLLNLFDRAKADPLVVVKLREWNALLSRVYGSSIGDPVLFVNHTYLILVSRIIVTLALRRVQPKRNELRGLMDGDYFLRQLNLTNLAEPDFFSWPLDTCIEQEFIFLFDNLFKHFTVFDYSKLSEDVLKNLYQELIDPETRHDLGEYYTPDWLAQFTLMKINYRGGRILDPACGSGAFLFAAILRLRSAGYTGGNLLRIAQTDIIGIDVHPVAVLLTKANMLLAMRDELLLHTESVTLRVYMADTLMAEEDKRKGVLTIPVSKTEAFHIPLATVARGQIDELIDFLSDLAHRASRDEEAANMAMHAAKGRITLFDNERESFWWIHNYKLLVTLDKSRRNTIWAYILKNTYRPEFLRKEKVDFVVGNPPWLGYAFIKDKRYQRRIKELAFLYDLIASTDTKLFPRLDAWSIFFVHCETEFLRETGTIAFVLPKNAMLPAKQHKKLQQRGFTELHDFSGVRPLFNVLACLAIRARGARTTKIPLTEWQGLLPRKNMSIADAEPILKSKQSDFNLAFPSDRKSPYYDRFFQGATLVPRALCFVAPVESARLNTLTPFIRTSSAVTVAAKKPWNMTVEGQIECKYLYGTVLAKDLLPFIVRAFSLVALPAIITRTGKVIIVDAAEALSQGDAHAYDWFSNVESIWAKHRKDANLSLADRIDYQHTLSNQRPRAQTCVIYNQSGTNISAALVTQEKCTHIDGLAIQGYLVDSKTYYYYPKSEAEGHYLVGLLNTAFVNNAIKPFQPQGLMGERDIHRRPFEACFLPLFDPTNEIHLSISKISRHCRDVLLDNMDRFSLRVASARNDARRIVSDDLQELDGLALSILTQASDGSVSQKESPASDDSSLI